MVRKNKSELIPRDPLLEISEEDSREAGRKRMAWIFGVALGLIALLYWGLNQSKPKTNGAEVFTQGENSPDAVIEKFHLVSTVQGQKRWSMDADTARFYQSQKLAYADVIYAQYFKKDKLISTLTAEKATINTDSNATQAEGHVELIVENGSKLETDKLNWEPDTDLIKTDSRVHVYKGMDDITAVGMVADTQLNNIRFMRDVHTQVRDTREIENFDNAKKF